MALSSSRSCSNSGGVACLSQAAKESFRRNSVQVRILIRIGNVWDSIVTCAFALDTVEQKAKEDQEEDRAECRAERHKDDNASRAMITYALLVTMLENESWRLTLRPGASWVTGSKRADAAWRSVCFASQHQWYHIRTIENGS